MKRYSDKQQGLTLIELMVALTLSLFLLLGLTEVFTANRATYRMAEEHARLQENARFAMDIVSRDIRSAGYTSCRAIENLDLTIVASGAIAAMDATNIINGTDNQPDAADATIGAIKQTTDTITIQSASGCGGQLNNTMASANDTITIFADNACGISQDDVLLIADCEDAHVFKVSNVVNDAGNNTQIISHADTHNITDNFCSEDAAVGACSVNEEKLYRFDAELLQLNAFTYFIRNDALWRFNNNFGASASNPVELIEGIEDMQISYGIDDNFDDVIDGYENAQTVTNNNLWPRVISARISFLVQSLEDNITDTPQAIVFNGQNIDGADGRLRRIFTSTIGIRNRVQ